MAGDGDSSSPTADGAGQRYFADAAGDDEVRSAIRDAHRSSSSTLGCRRAACGMGAWLLAALLMQTLAGATMHN